MGLVRKYLGPTIYFPSSPPNQTHYKKVFFPIFSPNFSIYPISPSNKHTLRVSDIKPFQPTSITLFSSHSHCFSLFFSASLRHLLNLMLISVAVGFFFLGSDLILGSTVNGLRWWWADQWWWVAMGKFSGGWVCLWVHGSTGDGQMGSKGWVSKDANLACG